MEQIRYRLGTLSARELEGAAQRELRDFKAELRLNGAETAEAVREITAVPDESFRVSQDGAGLDPISTAIIVSVALPLAGELLLDLWRHVILPRILARYGADAVGEQLESPHADDDSRS